MLPYDTWQVFCVFLIHLSVACELAGVIIMCRDSMNIASQKRLLIRSNEAKQVRDACFTISTLGGGGEESDLDDERVSGAGIRDYFRRAATHLDTFLHHLPYQREYVDIYNDEYVLIISSWKNLRMEVLMQTL